MSSTRRIFWLAVIGVSGAFTSAACSGTDAYQPLGAPPLLQVHGQFTWMSENGGMAAGSLPYSDDFSLFVDPDARSLIVMAHGNASPAALATTDRSSFTAVTVAPVNVPYAGCGASADYTSFSLSVDGSAGTVSGTASGTAEVYSGDEGFRYDLKLTFAGTRQTEGPTLTLPTLVDPFRVPALTVSAPLSGSTEARLVSGGDSFPLAPTGGSANVVTGFLVPQTVLPRYGTAYDVLVSPWQDLAANPGQPIGKLTAQDAPPLLADGGFEDGSTTVGGAAVIDASVLPPISGQHSLVVTSTNFGQPLLGVTSQHLAVRLPVQAGDTVVRFVLQFFGGYQFGSTSGVQLRVGAPGGGVTAVTLPSEMLSTQATGTLGQTLWLGAVRTIEVPLPSGTTTEVVVDALGSANSTLCGLPSPSVSLLLDDLRVE